MDFVFFSLLPNKRLTIEQRCGLFCLFFFLYSLLYALQWQNAKSLKVGFLSWFCKLLKNVCHSRYLIKNHSVFQGEKKKCAYIYILTERPSYAPPPTPAPATVSIVIFLINTDMVI